MSNQEQTISATVGTLVHESILSIENPSKAFKNQMSLYAEKVKKIAEQENNNASDLIDFWKVLIDNNFTGFFDAPDEVYHLSPGLNQSSLKDFKKSQGKYFHNRYVQPKQYKSAAIDEGTLIHDLILTPENLDKYYNDDDLCKWAKNAYEDENDKKAKNIRATAIYKEQKTVIEKEGRILIKGELFNNLGFLKSEILDHKFFKELIDGAFIEKAMYVICKHSGLLIRGKCDLISKDGYITDIKTIDENFSLEPVDIGRRMLGLGQNLQAPHYENLYEQILKRKPKNFIYFHIERRAPFETNIGPLDIGAGDKSEQDYFSLLKDASTSYEHNFINRKKAIKMNAISFPHCAFNEN